MRYRLIYVRPVSLFYLHGGVNWGAFFLLPSYGVAGGKSVVDLSILEFILQSYMNE